MKYNELVEFYLSLSKTTKRLEKTRLTSEFLKKVPKNELREVVNLLEGSVFPSYSQEKLGVSTQLVIKAIAQTSGKNSDEIESKWKEIGDLGETAKSLLSEKSQMTLTSVELTVHYVFENIEKIARFEGSGTVSKKLGLIADLLSNASGDESLFIVRTLIGDLRIGLASGVLRDSIAWAYLPQVMPLFREFGFESSKGVVVGSVDEIVDEPVLEAPTEKIAREIYNVILEYVQRGYDLTNDFAEVALIAKESGINGLKKVKPILGVPVRSMEAVKEEGVDSAFEAIGESVIVENKYDGYKIQIHKKGDKVWLYTRRQEDVTLAFPEIVGGAKKYLSCKSCIVEGECMAYDVKTKKTLPFQSVSRRIKRKHNIEEVRKEIPVEIKLFDVLYLDGESLLSNTILERRKILEGFVKEKKQLITLSEQIVTSDKKQVEEYYKKSLDEGYEGVMVKNPLAIYRPGRYVGFQFKLKPTLEHLDLVIVGAEWGTGKRSGWLSSYSLACRSGDEYLECGKIGTGIKEKESEGPTFTQMTDILKKNIISEKGREVKIKPNVVVEIAYEEIQESKNYESGYALRFPRLVKIRDDKKPQDANNLKDVKHIYSIQKGKSN